MARHSTTKAVIEEDRLRLGPARLERLIEARTQPGADTEAIDRRIWELYGERWAIVFTDLSGFSRQVARFGIIHFLQVIHEHKKLLYPLVEAHGGVLVKAEADSLLLLFRHAQWALDCCVAMRRACQTANEHRQPEERILLCQGLGYGELLRVSDHEVWGREVNAASKLGEDTARTDDILMTDSFRRGLLGAEDHQFSRIDAVSGSEKNWRYLG